jgi:hypothetical protein
MLINSTPLGEGWLAPEPPQAASASAHPGAIRRQVEALTGEF